MVKQEVHWRREPYKALVPVYKHVMRYVLRAHTPRHARYSTPMAINASLHGKQSQIANRVAPSLVVWQHPACLPMQNKSDDTHYLGL